MPYELRLDRIAVGTFDTQEEAVAEARRMLQAHPDAEPEVIDTKTGHAAEPAGSLGWRQELAKKIGY